MYTGRLVFAQFMDFHPKYEFDCSVARYRGNHKVRDFSCLDQWLCMAFAQLTGKESLREIETCLRAMQPKLYHAGFRGHVSRSTLADANEHRDWRIYADFAAGLIRTARRLYTGDGFGVDLANIVYALDSTTVDLCLSLFPWARFRKHKAAVKVHTLLDLRGSIPSFIRITDGKTHDVFFLDEVILEPGAFYIMDRGYIDFARLYRFTQALAFFVTRAKTNCAFTRISYRHVDKSTGLRCDETIRLCGPKTSAEYPVYLRRISYFDAETGRHFVFLTNNFELPALTIALLYKKRWKIELFFKWIKQHLRIKAFFGTSQNAVKTQVWIAISVYVLVAIIKKELAIKRNLSEILQILSIALFEKVELYQVLTATAQQNEDSSLCNQLELFDL
jgi:hypothetical protein